MAKNDGAPVFPQFSTDAWGKHSITDSGLTLREWFAKKEGIV